MHISELKTDMCFQLQTCARRRRPISRETTRMKPEHRKEKHINLPSKSFKCCGVGVLMMCISEIKTDLCFLKSKQTCAFNYRPAPVDGVHFRGKRHAGNQNTQTYGTRKTHQSAKQFFLHVAVSEVLVMCISWKQNLDARGRHATYREAPRGANQFFEKKNGRHFPFANGKGAKVHFSTTNKKTKQTNIS